MVEIDLEICLTQGQTWPMYSVNVDHHQIIKEHGYLKIVKHTGTIVDQLLLLYAVKHQNETIVKDELIVRDQAIEILNLRVDGIKIPKNMIEKLSYYNPKYRLDYIDYCKKTNINIDYGPLHAVKFWHAGTWTMPFENNFWSRYQQARQHMPGTDFTGNNREDIQRCLERLKLLL